MRKGWEMKRLGDVCETGAGGTPLKSHKDYYEGGTIPWLLSGEVSQGEIYESENFITEKGLQNSSARLFPPNTVLVAMYGATAGQVGILKFECSTNQAVCGILPNKNYLPKFLYYCFLSKKDELISQAVGGAQPNISQIKIKNTFIPAIPLPEQQRIVSTLNEAFASIAQAKSNAERNLVNTRELFDSVLQRAFANTHKGWVKTTIGAEIDLLVGFAFKSDHYTESANSIRLLRGDNIVQGALRWDGVKKYPLSEASKYSAFDLKEGDLVLAMDRPWIKAGMKYATISKSDLPCLLVQRTACLRSGKNLENSFLRYLISSREFAQHVLGVQTGLGVPHISGGQIKDFEFLRPPLAEQRAIVGQLEALSAETGRLEEIYQQKVESLEELKKSVLGKAFEGEL